MWRLVWTVLVLTTLLVSCADDPAFGPPPAQDQPEDLAPEPDAPHDVREDDDATPDMPRQRGPRVDVALSAYTEGASTGGGAMARQIADASDLISGPVALGRVGDYLLANRHGRYIIEAGERVMSPCPYGGNLIDAERLDATGQGQGDALGEICALINIGQTVRPEQYEVLRDGADGGAAVVAVSGGLEQLDFLNFKALARDVVAGLVLPLDPDVTPPVRVTIYYILRPDDVSVRAVLAFRNDGELQVDMAMSQLIAGGAEGGYFNPLNGKGGFGYDGLSASTLGGAPLPFLAWSGPDAGYAFLPDADPTLTREALPVAGVYVTTNGAAATLLGRTSLVSTVLTQPARIPTLPGLMHLGAGEIGQVSFRLFAGDGALASVLNELYPAMGVATGRVSGVVRGDVGEVVAGATVTAIDAGGRAFNQARADGQGRYQLVLPAGMSYTLRARADGQPPSLEVNVALEPDDTLSEDLTVYEPATLRVSVRQPSGAPTPARVSVLCEGPCPGAPAANERDITSDALPAGWAAVATTDLNGELSLPLPAGAYRVAVTRGITWSMWPQDAGQTGGALVNLIAGEATALDAELAQVVDTTGALSGDFHIHALTSTDSAVPFTTRVMDYVAEGVDVMVSSDHDYITDFRPAIAALGAQDHVVGVVGDEITTSDLGHLNAFPLERDDSARTGGALDWGAGPGPGLMLDEIFAWADSFPGEQVIQVNHPTGTGTIGSLQVDVLQGISLADAVTRRLPDQGVDPLTGDTRLWSERFTAIEVFNGHDQATFWAVMRWWLTMIGRGFTPTGTAVTDTHRRFGDLGGAPRSFVFVGEAHDAPSRFNLDQFARSINAGQLVGSSGPFMRVGAINGAGERAGLGEVLASGGEEVVIEVELQLPEWMSVDTLELFSNVEGIITAPGEAIGSPISPTLSQPIVWEEADMREVEVGAQGTYRRRHKTIALTLPGAARDAYVVVVARAVAPASMAPVVPSASVRPLAFSNPIYIDGDGGGYDQPHLAQAAAEARRRGGPSVPSARALHHAGVHATLPRPEPAPVALTLEHVGWIVEAGQCSAH